MNITRRYVFIGTVLAAISGLTFAWVQRRAEPNHAIVVGNLRDSSHEVTVETALGDDEQTFGPRTVSQGGHWDVTEVTERGELTVRFSVDGELVWEDAHEIPTPSGSRRSIVLLELQPDDEILTRVKVED